MAVGAVVEPFTPVVAGERPTYSKRYALLASVGSGILVTMALAALVVQGRSTELMEGNDETMKGWEDGMYPPGATFPAGYSFGDNNVFGKNSKFGAGDTFGDKNSFGEGSKYGAGVTIGDDNSFGKGQTFGPGLRMGNRETIGARSTFAEGSMIGDENQVGRKVKFGRRVSIGEKNQFGFEDEFGSNDQLGQENEFGRGTLFGSKILMYKKQEFGSRNTFTTPIYLTGEDEFGTRDWGLTPDDVPAGDRKAWSDTAAAYPDFVPPRDIRDHVLILDAVDKKAHNGPLAPHEAATLSTGGEAPRTDTKLGKTKDAVVLSHFSQPVTAEWETNPLFQQREKVEARKKAEAMKRKEEAMKRMSALHAVAEAAQQAASDTKRLQEVISTISFAQNAEAKKFELAIKSRK